MATDLIRVLHECHDTLRRTQFDEALRERVSEYDKKWRTLRSKHVAEYIQGRCVVAETFEYFGDYQQAAAALADDDQNALQAVFDRPLQTLAVERTKWKRLIWLTMAKAQVEYRVERYDEAMEILRRCQEAVVRLAADTAPLYGTRARLAHFMGQVHRQVGAYTEARRAFSSAAMWASRRFVAHTGFVEITGPVHIAASLTLDEQRKFDAARSLASWTLGKCHGIGIGWIDLTTGSLAAAELHLQTGFALLRMTGDWIHRAYTSMLIGVLDRARAYNGDDDKILERAVARIAEAKKGLAGHPFRLRACYELAQGLLRLGKTDDARREIGEMLSGLSPSNARGASGAQQSRWECNGKIVASRIERAAYNFTQARDLAQEAQTLAANKFRRGSVPWIEATIAFGEALVETGRDESRQMALDCFKSARKFADAKKNPTTVAACSFHIARTSSLLGDQRAASDAYATGRRAAEFVEHGFVKRLDDKAAEAIAKANTFFISSDLQVIGEVRSDPPATAVDVQRRIEAFLAHRAVALTPNRALAAELLGIDVRTLRRWLKRRVFSHPRN